MSFTEILAELPNLTSPQREEIVHRIEAIQRLSDPDFLDEMDRRIDRMQAGEGVSDEQLKEIVQARLGRS
jgi:hypothetical protein